MDSALFHPEAQAEYEEAWAWYGQRSPEAASRFEAEVERALAMIVADSGRFARYDDHHRYFVLRKFPYSIVYREYMGGLCVIAVAHAARKPDYWQGRY